MCTRTSPNEFSDTDAVVTIFVHSIVCAVCTVSVVSFGCVQHETAS